MKLYTFINIYTSVFLYLTILFIYTAINNAGVDASSSGDIGFKLSSSSLSILHVKAISRIYGENGYEILALLKEAPTGISFFPFIISFISYSDIIYKLLISLCIGLFTVSTVCVISFNPSLLLFYSLSLFYYL